MKCVLRNADIALTEAIGVVSMGPVLSKTPSNEWNPQGSALVCTCTVSNIACAFDTNRHSNNSGVLSSKKVHICIILCLIFCYLLNLKDRFLNTIEQP